MSQHKLILIAGPTASGKSAAALERARRENGAIINADAMQIYAGLPILSAQPSTQDQQEIPHELYSTLDPAEPSSAGKWSALAEAAIRKAVEAGRTPILVGGTGLYFKALLEGLAEIPDVPDSVREKVQTLHDQMGSESFRQELARLDPDSAAQIEKNDRQRLVRAYEVVIHTGKPLSYWQKQPSTGGLKGFTFERILLLPERDKLYAACDQRFSQMIERGAIDEVKQILKRNLDPNLPAMKTLGLREIAAYLKNEIGLDEAITKAQQATRNYAKRQITWFRNQWKN